MARSFVDKLKRGLFMTHTEILERIGDTVRRPGPVDREHLNRVEEALLAADVGVELSMDLVEKLSSAAAAGRIKDSSELLPALKTRLVELLDAPEDHSVEPTSPPRVSLLVGVNGTGKTTTLAKLAARRKEAGRTVLMAAADTFRAAAVEQLQVWADRVDVPLIRQKEGADPAAVVFDAMAAARARGVDDVLVDTAGRLHNRANLMAELEKIRRVSAREVPGAPHEVLLVIDATTGSNGIAQAESFLGSAGVTGVVLTKLDGTAKGGVAVAIAQQLQLPVRWVGVGEGVDDLLPFHATDFIEALLDER